jgi:hypothetical protein
MSYGSPTKMLEIARARMTPEQWEKFEADFEHFCAYSGLNPMALGGHHEHDIAFIWAKWAYLSAQPSEPQWVDIRTRNAYFEKIAIASMTDEQAQRSLQRFSMWQRIKGETA